MENTIITDKIDEFPRIPEALLQALNRLYPERTPKITDPLPTIYENIGKREVVRYLNALYKRQTGRDLNLHPKQ